MSAPEPDYTPDRRLPAAAAFAVAAFGVLFAAHCYGLTALTSNLDHVKNLTLRFGGGGGLAVWALLTARGEAPRMPRPLLAGWGAWLAALLLATLLGAEAHAKWIGWQTLMDWTCAAGWFAMAFVAAGTLRSTRLCLRGAAVLVLPMCLFGLLHFAGALEGIRDAMWAGYERAAARGESVTPSGFYALLDTYASSREMMSTILNKQFFGVFLAALLPLTLGAAVTDGASMVRAAAGEPPRHGLGWLLTGATAALLAAVCMLLTFSKIVMLLIPGAAVFLVAVHVLTPWKILRVPAWPVAAACLGVLFITLLVIGRTEIATQLSALGTSVSSRTVMWSGALAMFGDNPVFGVGPGAFRLEFPAYRPPDYFVFALSNYTLSAHNLFLDVLAETGLIGALAFGLLVASVFVLGANAVRKSPSAEMRVAVLAGAFGFFLLLFGNLATSMMRWPVGFAAFGVVAGFAAGAARTAREGNFAAPRVGNPHAAYWNAGAVAALLLTLFFVQQAWTNFRAAMFHMDALSAGNIPNEIMRSADPRAQAIAEARLREAIEFHTQAIETDPTMLTAYYKRAFEQNRLANLYRDRFQAAQAADAPPERQRGLMNENIRWTEETFDTYTALQQYAPEYSEVIFNRALLSMGLGRDLADASLIAGTPPEETADLAERAQQTLAEGAEYADLAMARSNKIGVHTTAAQIHLLAARALPEDDPAAAEHYRRAGEISLGIVSLPEIPNASVDTTPELERRQRTRAAYRAPEMYYQAGDYERAATLFEELIETDPGTMDLYRRAVDSWARADRKDAALRVLDTGLARNPLNADLLLLRAEVLLKFAETDEDNRELLVEVLTIDELQKQLGEDWLTDAQQTQLAELMEIARERL